jgi:hypothetical protein
MQTAFLRRDLTVAAVAAAVVVLAGCASGAAEEEAARAAAEAAAAAHRPPPVSLGDSVAESASIYVAFTRDMAAIEGGFESPEAVQAALRRGSAYNPDQLSQGLIAYAAIIALQSPEFVAGVRQYASHRPTRERLVSDIVADPRQASWLPGSQAAAGLIMATLRSDIDALARAADSIENDAYAVQARQDPRRTWAVAPGGNLVGRLEAAKARSGEAMRPSAADAEGLSAAALSGAGLPVSGSVRQPPHPLAVERALALAALAALGAAGDAARADTDALQREPVSQGCLASSKLNLFQCLAASRPSYEDMFCLGRHIVRDLATCTRGVAMPAAVVSVSDLVPVGPPVAPAATSPDAATPPTTPFAAPAAPVPPSRPEISPTERLNRGENTPE